MKSFRLILITCLSILLFTISCDKEIVDSNSTVTEKKQQVNNSIAKLRTDIDKKFLNFDFAKHRITPLWDLAIISKNKKTVEIPYTIDNKLMMPVVSKNSKQQGRQRLLLTLSGANVSAIIIQYIPDLTFSGNIKDINVDNFKMSKFDGKVVFQKLGENISNVWYLEKGKISKKTTRSKANNKSLKVKGWVCQTFCQDTNWYQESNGEWIYTNTTTECWDECEFVDDTPPYDPYDCNNDSSWPWCNNGNGGGGGPSAEEQCYANLEAIANNTSPSDETISEEIISNSGGLVEKKYIWKALNGPIWHIESTEHAVINTNTNMFESLTHEKAEIVGTAALTTLMSHSITCNPQSSEPSTYKVVTLYFTIGYGLVFENNSCAITKSYNQPKILYPNL